MFSQIYILWLILFTLRLNWTEARNFKKKYFRKLHLITIGLLSLYSGASLGNFLKQLYRMLHELLKWLRECNMTEK